jgi:lysophospholipase L1-like esterase
MKILFYGDSITDAFRDRSAEIGSLSSYGCGFVNQIVGRLLKEEPEKYQIINTGISGNRIVDLYARIKSDCWNYEPDVLSILVGINDIWHEVKYNNGVELDRFEKVYDMLLEDTIKRLPNVKIIICEPFVLHGTATNEAFDGFNEIRTYAKVIKKLADKYNAYFLPLQYLFDKYNQNHDASFYLFDGVHPTVQGGALIADEWVKFFKKEIDK